MSFNADELLLAHTLRTIAKEKRTKALQQELDHRFGKWRAGDPTSTDEEHNAKMDFQEAWGKANPLQGFVLEALKELEDIAVMVRTRP